MLYHGYVVYIYLMMDSPVCRRYCRSGPVRTESQTQYVPHLLVIVQHNERYTVRRKGKAVPLQAWSGPEGSRKLRLPDYMTTVQDCGRLSALRTGRLYAQEMLLVLISVRS